MKKSKAKPMVQAAMFAVVPNERHDNSHSTKEEKIRDDLSNLGIGDGKNFGAYIKYVRGNKQIKF